MDNQKLTQLSRAFSVHDIMTETPLLERADTLAGARMLVEKYDCVPYPQNGAIEGFFTQNGNDVQNLERRHIISENTSLLDLPQLFSEDPFYFVISANRISGYVHYSDLNKPIARIPFFAIFHAVERKFWEEIKGRISEEILAAVFGDHAKQLLKRRKRAQKQNLDLGWVGVFYFPEILKLAKYYRVADLSDEDVELMKNVRKRVAHSDHSLVEGREDLGPLAKSQRLFQSLMD